MRRKSFVSGCLLIMSSLLFDQAIQAQADNYDDVVKIRMHEIAESLGSLLFANRFESIESPCLFIDSLDDRFASPNRKPINSNYRSRLLQGKIDSSGVKCLSSEYAKYLRLKVDSVNNHTLTITGSVQLTYGYPASTIMQYLCRNLTDGLKDTGYFNRFISNKGWFSLYPERDKYVLALVLQEEPYDCKDTAFGFLEITKDFFQKNAEPSYNFLFDRISLAKGDKNNQLSLRFTSTSEQNEMEYYTYLVYSVMKYIGSPDKIKGSSALWLKNYLTNPACLNCALIYEQALAIKPVFQLPNTRPQPAH